MRRRSPKLIPAILICLLAAFALPASALGLEPEGLQAGAVGAGPLAASLSTDGGHGTDGPPSGYAPRSGDAAGEDGAPGASGLAVQASEGDFEVKDCPGGVEVTSYVGEGGDVAIPSTIGEKAVVSLGEAAFLEKGSVKSVSVPASVKSIGAGCFCRCWGMETVTLAEGLESVGTYAFEGTAISTIDIPASVKSLGGPEGDLGLVFYDCQGLEAISVSPANAAYSAEGGVLYSKGKDVLLYCPIGKTATAFSIPSSVKAVASYGFYQNSGIGQITIPPSVTGLGNWCFDRSAIKRAVVPATVETVGDGIFDGCWGLEELTYESAAPLGYRFCEGCTSLTSVSLSEGVRSIDMRTFKGCSSLAAIRIPASVTEIEGSAFYECGSLASIDIPPAVKTVGSSAFCYCSKLSSVTGAAGVERIESYAFYGTAISSYPWSGKLRFVSGSAFGNCKNFQSPNYPPYLEKSDSGDYRVFDDSFVISGTADYGAASQVLALTNKERAAQGVSPLAMDGPLQAAAMRRAAEISLLFEHTRPDGSSCLSADPAMSGENIAAGSSTAEGTMNQWMNSWGHRENILSSDFKSIGVGCVKVGSITYWVQCFGSGEGSGTTAGTGAAKVSYTAKVDYDTVSLEGSGFNLNEGLGSSMSMAPGETKELNVGVMNAGWPGVYCPLDGASFTWASSNPSVASVTRAGVVAAGKAGTAVVTAKSAGGKVWSVAVEVGEGAQGARSAQGAGVADGEGAAVGGATYRVVSNAKSTAVFESAGKGAKSATIPAAVTINGKKYAVVGIARGAFKGAKARTVTVKSRKLTKKSVKNCFKGSKVKTVKVKVGSRKANKKYVKKYKKIFTKKNCGAKVAVK